MGKRSKNFKELYPNPVPITLSTDAYGINLPDIIPHNPISWLIFGLRYLQIQAKSIPSNVVRVDFEDDVFKVLDPTDMNRLWSHGFFGKGSLSRSDPNWADRTSARLGLDDDTQQGRNASEEITKQRREERKRFKLERAKVQNLELKQRQGALNEDEEVELNDLRETLNNLKKIVPARKAISTTSNSLREEDEVLLIEGLDNLEYLQLQAVESFYLKFALGAIDIFEQNESLSSLELFKKCNSIDSKFMLNYVVYHHFRSLGWCARSGIKFGCDMLLYKRGPPFSHAEFGILIIPTKQEFINWIDVSSVARVVGGVKKNLVLCYVDEPIEDIELSEVSDIASLLKLYKVTEILYRRWTPSKSRD
ncbi:tRNA-splicing endonuclease subunit Sen2p [[Candida] railenensis]|uniref:tRNA-splicing endonuclease subunit Sen2 n=1 Tax=[Candida] railenensis TaxID=45579 RepID=A0A9P0QP67_9ASCO|nr:tRNA-splicing endonuclease subunit Sen2p [[Candida] railenensis]